MHTGKVGQVRNSPFLLTCRKSKVECCATAVAADASRRMAANWESRKGQPTGWLVCVHAEWQRARPHNNGQFSSFVWLLQVPRTQKFISSFAFRPPILPANDHPIKRRSLVIKQCLINIRRFKIKCPSNGELCKHSPDVIRSIRRVRANVCCTEFQAALSPAARFV